MMIVSAKITFLTGCILMNAVSHPLSSRAHQLPKIISGLAYVVQICFEYYVTFHEQTDLPSSIILQRSRIEV
jgi:hypothetical protein